MTRMKDEDEDEADELKGVSVGLSANLHVGIRVIPCCLFEVTSKVRSYSTLLVVVYTLH